MPLTFIELNLLLNCLVVNLLNHSVAALRLVVFHVDINGSIAIIFSEDECSFSVHPVVNVYEHLLDRMDDLLLGGPLEFGKLNLEVATFLWDQHYNEACSHVVNQVRELRWEINH